MLGLPSSSSDRLERPSTVNAITSRQNALVARFRSAREQRRDQRSHVVLDGLRLISDVVNGGKSLDALLVSAASLPQDPILNKLVQQCEAKRIKVTAGSGPVMDAVSPMRTPSTAVALMKHSPMTADSIIHRKKGCVLVPIGVQDPGNLGSIIRVAAAADLAGVVVDTSSADPFNWKALRGSMGNTFRLPVTDTQNVSQLISHARHAGWTIAATTPRGGLPPHKQAIRKPIIILLGNEGTGLDPQLLTYVDLTISIPMANGVESLNVSSAAAVVAYEIQHQRISHETA